MDKIGESSNLNNKADMAVAFAIGKVHTNQFYLENSSDFKSVKIVKKLPKRKEIKGKITSIDEIPSVKNYYDGTTKLKIEVTSCHQWSTMQESCLNSKVCGWCWATKSCIPGNGSGPLAPCMRGRFEFGAPKNTWNPHNTDKVKITRQNIQGAQLTTITPQ